MYIEPFNKVGDFSFYESLAEIEKKVLRYEKFHIADKYFLDKKNPTIYIYDVDTLIVFNEQGSNILYINIGDNAFHNGVNLHTESLQKIKKHYAKVDKSLKSEQGEVEIPMFGIIVYKETGKKGNMIMAYSHEYTRERKITPEEIIKYYLGDIDLGDVKL